jgi:CRISPR-associated endonuclease/helicase Cas3
MNPMLNNIIGKTTPDGKNYPLIAHTIDTSSVCELLLNYGVKNYLSNFFENSESIDLVSTLSFWISLHDIGKATPQFQKKIGANNKKLEEYGLPFINSNDYKSHALDSALILRSWDRERYARETILSQIAKYIAMHHGTVFVNNDFRCGIKKTGGKEWKKIQFDIIEKLYELYSPEDSRAINISNHAFYLAFTGFLVYCDWIASMDSFTSFRPNSDNIAEYRKESLQKADKALNANALYNIASLVADSFSSYFKGISTPRKLQSEIISIAEKPVPSLTIIEAPTGEGKTEAALYLAVRQQVAQNNRGIYIAMPTMATSNAIYDRFITFLKSAHEGKTTASAMLIHSHSRMNESMKQLLANYYNSNESNSNDEEIIAPEWFLPSKRSLLAPYGVGTVDQTFLSILNVRHFFLRLFGLAGKTVVFDEVHAYDSYMSELFLVLLKWLKALKSNVIILSATLPSKLKNEMTIAWGSEDDGAKSINYPLITTVNNEGTQQTSYHSEQKRRIRLNTFVRDDEKIVSDLVENARAGCDAAYIVNTVGRCQEIFELVRNKSESTEADIDIYIFHSRFTFGDRKRIEAEVRGRFGIGKTRKRGAVVIATQVIEQSLDLDFDIMYSDIAPIDLLLQRAGRLHRHNNMRPETAQNPVMNIVMPETDDDGLPQTNEISKVYEDIIIYRTYFLLKQYDEWNFPRDYRPLIEGVYDPDVPIGGLDNSIEQVEQAGRRSHTLTMSSQALKQENRIYLPTELEFFFADDDKPMPEENHKHPFYRMKTRLGDPSISLILLFKSGRDICVKNDSGYKKIQACGTVDFIYGTINLNANYFDGEIEDIMPDYWHTYRSKHKTVKNLSALELINNETTVNNQIFKYNDTIGLQIIKGF